MSRSSITNDFQDHSIASLSGASEELFAARAFNQVIERVVHNPSATAIAVNCVGGAAAMDTAGSIEIAAGGTLTLYNTNLVNVIGTAAAAVTAYER